MTLGNAAFRRRVGAAGVPVTIHVDGEPVTAREGDSVAAALLAAGGPATRATLVSGEPRGPFCLYGACFECVLEIDGVRSCQGCLVPVRDGMQVRRMQDRGALGATHGHG